MIAGTPSSSKENNLPYGTKLIIINLLKDEEKVKEMTWREKVCIQFEKHNATMKNQSRKKKRNCPKINIFTCDRCSFRTDNEEPLNAHKVNCHAMKMCEICKKVLTKDWLKEHLKAQHYQPDVKPHCCTLCPFATRQKRDLRMHVNAIHLNIKPFKCDMCQYAAVQKKDVDRHRREVHLKSEVFKCKICKFTTHVKRCVKMHYESVHLKLKPIQCLYCPRSYRYKNQLNIHLQRKNHRFAK